MGRRKGVTYKQSTRFQRWNAESGMSGTSPNRNIRYDDNTTTESKLQEEVEKKYTGKRKRAIRTAQTMQAVAEKLEQEENEKLKLQTVPMVGHFVRPPGYKVYHWETISPAKIHFAVQHHGTQTDYAIGQSGAVEQETSGPGSPSPECSGWWWKRAPLTLDCGSFLEFHVQPDVYKLAHSNFCKFKFCPYCMWRRSLKVFGQISKVMDWLMASDEYKGNRYIFLTLTQRNCTAAELPEVLDRMTKAWAAVAGGQVLPGKARTKAYSWLREKVIRGAFRVLEVTVNHEDDTYHPHFHIVLAVPHNYFLKKNPWYMSHADWVTVWRCAMGLDYDPLVSIEGIKPDPEQGYSKAVAEVSKYPVKDSDYQGPDIPAEDQQKYLYTLVNALHHRRLLSWTGCFFKARRALGLVDPESEGADLADDEITVLRPDVETVVRVYRWRVGIGGIGGQYQRDTQAEADAEKREAARRLEGIAIDADDFDG